MKTAPRFPASIAGFTLVEICLAIGVVAFAFVGIVGLLPAGMSVFRGAMNTSISSQLVQRVLNEAQQTDFKQLTSGNSAPGYYELYPLRYFDEQGNELQASEAKKSLYHVHAVVQNAPKFPNTDGGDPIEMKQLASVVVQVAVNPSGRPLPKDGTTLLWNETPNVTMTSYPVLVANHD